MHYAQKVSSLHAAAGLYGNVWNFNYAFIICVVFHVLLLTLTVLVTTIDAQWEGMGDVGVSEVRADTTSPMPDHKGFKLQ